MKLYFEINFKLNNEDHCVNLKTSKSGFMIISIYVGDILLAENDKKLMESTKVWLFANYGMKGMV